MLRQEIGLKSLIFVAPGNLGTKERMVAFVVAGRKLVAKKFLMAETATRDFCLKNISSISRRKFHF